MTKGFVATPNSLVDLMVEELFRDRRPTPHSRVLDPGCGDGPFIDGIIRWCIRNAVPLPQMVGVELDPDRAYNARRRFSSFQEVEILDADFLLGTFSNFEYVIGNPPYVAISSLSVQERTTYRDLFRGATGRFDLYMLFFEHALGALCAGGRLVFVTPEKFLYVGAARELRILLAGQNVEDLRLIDEDTFDGLVTYPLVTSVTKAAPSLTRVTLRDGATVTVSLPRNGESWQRTLAERAPEQLGPTLQDITDRVSCGIATGADRVFVKRSEDVPDFLKDFAHPTISGRQIAPDAPVQARDKMLVPYTRDGKLIPENLLGPLADFLNLPRHKEALIARTCVDRKPWYAFHESPIPSEICRPKILCKDIGPYPFFVLDDKGDILPRHSVYYIIPSDPDMLVPLYNYLNSDYARQWLRDHCQRASKGFVRLQSHVLKLLPVPTNLAIGSGALIPAKKSA